MPEFDVLTDSTDLPAVCCTLEPQVTEYDVSDLSARPCSLSARPCSGTGRLLPQ